MSFYAVQVSFEQTYYPFPKETDESFRARLPEKTFTFAGKRLEELDSGEILRVHRPKTLNVSTDWGYKI